MFDDMRDSPELTPEPSVEPSAEPTELVEERAVYDGDISDSILRKLSAYYNDNSNNGADYVILRESATDYVLAYGTVNDHTFTGTIVRYHIQQSYQSTDCTVSVSNGSYNADMTGDTGYIYSSLSGFLPSYYINEDERLANRESYITSVAFFIALLTALVFTLLRGLFRRFKR